MINKIGKIGKLNIVANKKLKKLFLDKGKTRCEICGTENYLSFAHKHKRIYYRSHQELLSNFNQVLLLCIRCHMELEVSREQTEKIFTRLRGEEKMPLDNGKNNLYN